MQWDKTVESVAGIAGILGVLYLAVIDGLSSEVLLASILVIGGLGGYRIAKEVLLARGN